ncbi:hypothetical protein [Allocoleopsis sp.]|uniref:hypothetical protein n=1 Tax=Allocoleopsis sp. TaxID=3088169 RepID=UPI002FD5C03A
MSKFHWVFSTLLVTALIASVPIGSNQTTRAQMSPSGYGEDISGTLTKDNKPPVDPRAPVPGRTGTTRGRSNNPWARIFQALPKDKKSPLPPRTGAPRGPVCAIAPKSIGTNLEIWSDRPLFVWTGPFKRLELRAVGSDRILWRYNVKDKQNRVLYSAKEALQPGQTYEWRLFFSDQDNAEAFATEKFQVMDAQKRDRIQKELQSLNDQLQARKALPEDIAQQRAQYFAKQRLWSDVLQEAYRVENPSTALTAMVQAIPKEICPNPAEQSSAQPR